MPDKRRKKVPEARNCKFDQTKTDGENRSTKALKRRDLRSHQEDQERLLTGPALTCRRDDQVRRDPKCNRFDRDT